MPDRQDPRSLVGLILLHPLVLTFLLLSSYYPAHLAIPVSFWFLILAAFVFAAFLAVIQQWMSGTALLCLLFAGDIILVTFVVRFTGGVSSFFPLLYLVVVILAAFYLFRTGAYVTGLASVAALLVLYVFEARGAEQSWPYLMNRFYLLSLLLLLSAILSGHLSERYRQRSEELKTLLLTTEEIVKNMPSGLLTINGRGDIVYTNISEGDVLRRIHLHLARFMDSQGVPAVMDFSIHERYYVLTCARIRASLGAIGVLQDLTEMRRLEELSHVSEQTRLLAELGGSLAHEIRNPLASIRGSLELIAKKIKGPELAAFVGMALKEAIRLNEIVTDFLNFAQFTPSHLSRMRVGEVVTDALVEIGRHVAARGIELERRGDDFNLNADANKLVSALTNILLNAVEASPPGGRIQVVTGQDGAAGWIEVSDGGAGISSRNRARLFTPFFTTKKGGTGLGLAIAQRIVAAHDGRIEVTSQVGRGTTVRITLPIAR